MDNLRGDNAFLKSKIDSIVVVNESLKQDLIAITKKYTKGTNRIKELESKLGRRNAEISGLQAEINGKIAMIAQLEQEYGDEVQVFVNEKDDLQNQLDIKQKEANLLKVEKEDLQDKNAHLQQEKTRKERMIDIYSIIAFTEVEIHEFAPRNSKDKTIKKIKNDNWNSSIVTIKLKHKDEKLLENCRFAVKLYDADNEKVLEYLEGSDTTEESTREFDYNKDGNFVEFINYEKKEGKNYHLILYLVDDSTPNKKFNLLNKKPQIVRNGKPIAFGA